MKTAFSSFIYSRKGIYGILHVLILCLSLFLIISISMDTFHNIPFINQGSYLRIQFRICMFFLFDFLLEFFLAPDKWRYLSSHFVFLLVSIPYLNIIDYYHITFSPEVSYFLRFIPLLRGGYALAIVVGWLSGSKASGLFTSYITMLDLPRGEKSEPPLPPPIGRVVSEFLNVCSKARNFKIERFTDAWKRIPPLYGPIALLC